MLNMIVTSMMLGGRIMVEDADVYVKLSTLWHKIRQYFSNHSIPNIF
jgi:hypothetical protein